MLPTSVKIIKQLRKAGFEAYWAGGCVRDILMGRKPKDFDIVTSAKPDEIEDILEHTIPIGKQFGVVLALKDGHQFEIATFRSDAGYSDGRRPDAVTFTSAKEDAFRRDFTINGMFYDPVKDKVIDYVGGQKDLEARLIRFIGDPHERILEDHLRILRAVRFKNEFDFQYEPKTYQALLTHAALSDKVSNERIADELNKMLFTEPKSAPLSDMEDLGVLKKILPEVQNLKGVAQPFKYHQEGDVWNHTMMALDTLPETSSLAVRWAVLLHDIGKPETFTLKERIRFDRHVEASKKIAANILSRLHFPRKIIDQVTWLVEHHMMMVPLTQMPEGRRRHWFLKPYFLNLMQVFKADAEGTIPSDLSLYDEIYSLYHKTIKEIPRLPKVLIDGNDLMTLLKIKPGKKVGKILDDVREKQLEGLLKSKKQALDYAKKNYATSKKTPAKRKTKKEI
jgi:poly(A) polymerase